MMPVSGQSTEELEQNYVPMSANSPSHHHSGSLSEPVHEANYVPMTPSTMEFSSLGKQVPPPAHMGFRSSPKTPPRRPILSDCQPPPVDRNLKPDRKGEWGDGAHARADAFNSLWKSCVVHLEFACGSLTVLHLTTRCCSTCSLTITNYHHFRLLWQHLFSLCFTLWFLVCSHMSSLAAVLSLYRGLNSRIFLSDLWTSPGGSIL